MCFGGTASISVIGSGGTPSYFGHTGTHTGVLAGSPIYSITDANGCPASVPINVSEPPLLQVTAVITTPVSCFGGNATVSVTAIGGVPGYTGTGSFLVPAGLNIPFTVTDSNGCSKTVFIDITQPPLLVATASVTSPILCNGSTGVISISGSGGTPFTIPLPLYNGTGPITVNAGTGTYTISDANGCSAVTLPFTVTEPSLVVATATITSPILCNGGTAIIEVTGSGGVLGIGYTGDKGFHPGILAGPSPFYTIKDSNGCQSLPTSIRVVQPGILTATAVVTSPILCNGGTGDLDVQVRGGTAPYDYSWSSSSTTAAATNLIAGTYSCVINDKYGCGPIPTSIVLTQPDVLVFTTISSNPNCFPNRLYDNGTIDITITGGTNPFPVDPGWVRSTSPLTPNDWRLSGLSAGTYNIIIDDQYHCPSVSQPVLLTRPAPLTASTTSVDNINCLIKEVSQTNYVFENGGVPGYTFDWSGGNDCVPFNSKCMTTSVNGAYIVDVNDVEGNTLGCIPVQVPINVNLTVIGDALMRISSYSSNTCGIYAVNDPVTLTNISTGVYTSIQWSVDGIPIGINDSIIHNFTTIGDHTITLSVNYAIGGVTCNYTVSERIAITKGYNMVVPTAFTPNGDAWNAFIKPEFNCMQSVEMKVFDTWGSLLYSESGAILTGWDGAFKGKPSENGNYIMNVNATTLYGAVIEYNGPFILIK